MLKFLFAAALFVLFTAGINAQSEDCSKECSKDKAEVTKVSKHCETPETVSKDTENTEQVAGALADDKTKTETVVIKKEVKVATVKDDGKEEKGCCSTDKKKTDDPNK